MPRNDDGSFSGHSNADNIDIRYADRYIGDKRDLIFGVSANNNPSVSDPWNTARGWMQYVPVPSPTSSRFHRRQRTLSGLWRRRQHRRMTAYVFLEQDDLRRGRRLRRPTGLTSLMTAGIADADKTRLRGVNPYGAWPTTANGAHTA